MNTSNIEIWTTSGTWVDTLKGLKPLTAELVMREVPSGQVWLHIRDNIVIDVSVGGIRHG